MADFCQQCSIELFGDDFKDLAHDEKGFLEIICEGCGWTVVDNNGKCVWKNCEKHKGTILKNEE